MKANNSSSYSSASLLNIMIPKIQQLLPIETSLSGNWPNTNYSSEILSTTNKLLSPPISITPSSICTDLSESEYQPIDLSSSHKYSLSSPPLSNIKSESIDSIDCSTSPYNKHDSTMIISKHEKNPMGKLNSSYKITKQCTNFSIEHILSSSYRSPTYELLQFPHKQMNSIFTKKKSKHFSDNYLHRIIHHRKKSQTKPIKSYLFKYSIQPRNLFIRYFLNLYNNLINQHNHLNNQEKFSKIDALEQLADIACKIDTRYKTFQFNDDKLTSKNYELLLKQCYLLIKQIYLKFQQQKICKRLNNNSKNFFQKRFLHFSLSILNLLQRKMNILLYGTNHSDCHILMSDIQKYSIENKTMKKSICFYLKINQIISNFEILLPNNNLLYEATIQPIDNFNDLLLVRLNHERQTYLIPIHDLCRIACPKMIPNDFNILSKGSRVCAYWSTSLRGLHPAIVKKLPSDINQSSMISLLFDDGDTGLIKLNEIRLLPDDFNVKGIDLEEWRVSSFQIPSSSLSTATRRTCRRITSTSTISSNRNSSSKKQKTSSSSSTVVPQWTLNIRTSTISRQDNKEILRHGDCIVLHGVDKSLSYIGKVLKFYRNKSTQQDFVRLKWYYSPQETPIGLQENDLPGALYESTHVDENPIATIRYKGTIYKSYDDYIKKTNYGKKRKETDFYLVGQYNPTSGELQRFDDK